MFDFSLISGAAPGAVADRTTPGAGSPAAVAVSGAGAASFLDALAALAALSTLQVTTGDGAESVDGAGGASGASESEVSAPDDFAGAVDVTQFIATAYPLPVAQVPAGQPPVPSDLAEGQSETQAVASAVAQPGLESTTSPSLPAVPGEVVRSVPTPKGEAEASRPTFSPTYEGEASHTPTSPQQPHVGTSTRPEMPPLAGVPAQVVAAANVGVPQQSGEPQQAGVSSRVGHPQHAAGAPTAVVEMLTPSAAAALLQSTEAQASVPTVPSDVRRGGRGRFAVDHFRSARAEMKRPEMPTAAAPAMAAGLSHPAVATAFVPEVVSPATQVPAGSQAASSLTGAAAGASQDGRSSMDSHDQPAGFASGVHGQAGPRTGPVLAPPAVAAFTSMVTSLPSGDVLPAETTTQIVQSIRMQLLRDGGEAHIRLDPRQFGDMSVRIRVDQGQVTARVEADAPVVREWLQNNQHLLRQSLAGQQLTLDRLDVREPPATSDTSRRDGSPERDRDAPQQRPRRRRPDTGELFEVVA